jgi:Predicted membrane protein
MGGGLVSGWFLGFQSADTDRVGGLSFAIPSGIVLAGGLLVAGAIIWVLGQRMAAKTAGGSAVLAQSLGFKQYLVTAEARQIRFEEAQDIFSRYLPYAIVFGVADRWAGTFSEVAEAATAAGQSIGMPGWYIFAGSGGFGNFGGIASGMDSFSTMASGTFTSTPGSSGGSGFGGGGFSGGGGGGGGGSSW